MIKSIAFASILCGFLSVNSVQAQDLPDVAAGIQPNSSYHGGDVDHVSLANGALSLHIPLVSYPQKGSLSLSYSIDYNTENYVTIETCVLRSCSSNLYVVPTAWNRNPNAPVGAGLVVDQQLSAGGITQADPNISYPTYYGGRYYVITPDGAEHPLGHTSNGFRSVDGAGYLFQPSDPSLYPTQLTPSPTTTGLPTLPGNQGGTITDDKGIVYSGSTITDPDNNTILFTSNGVTDSVNRTIPGTMTSVSTSNCPVISASQYPAVQYQPVVSAAEWDIPTVGGGTAPYIFCTASVNISSNLALLGGGSQMKKTVDLLQSVKLPNGQFWGFLYDSADPNNPQSYAYGQLTTLVYPTGGSVNYSYSIGGISPCDSFRNNQLSGNGQTVNTYLWEVHTRQVLDNEGDSSTWTYSSGYDSGNLTGSVLSPAGDITELTFASPDGCALYDAGDEVYKGSSPSGTSLKNRTISNSLPNVPGFPLAYAAYPQSDSTEWQGANTSTVTNTYDGGVQFQETECDGSTCETEYTGQLPIGDIVSKKYTDFTGATLKTDNTTYEWQENSSYLNSNLLNIPYQTQTLNGSGSQVALTTFTYDESSYSPGGTRGHLTTQSKWLNTGSAPTTHTGWTTFGEASYLIDANGNHNTNGHTVDYYYQDTPAGCYDSVVTSTVNALNQSTSGGYDCNTGLLTSYTDRNAQITTFKYDDMRRPICVEYPDGGSTAFSFNDSLSALTVDRVTRLNGADACTSSTNNIDEEFAFDGLGRQIHTRLLSDPSGTVYTDTSYDVMGRVSAVTNPYRSTSDQTYGVTSYSYDALGRKVKQTDPDANSYQYWCYDGNGPYGQPNCRSMLGSGAGEWVDAADEAGNDWQRVSDSLGRLARVYEPNGSSAAPSMETDYGYDSLSNLLSVTQWGGPNGSSGARNRSFTYDSLSRLLTTSNPETGTITYTYDANGNVQTKTDARGFQINYGTYDGLNRSPGKTYSAGDHPVTYSYDASGPGNYGIGHRTGMTDGSGSTTWTYDSMGRELSESKVIAGINKTISTSYYPNGSVWKITYPSNAVIDYSFDNAGRQIAVNDDTNSIQYAQTGQYAPQDALSSLVLGHSPSFSGITESNQYNSRLQPAVLSAAAPAGTLLSLSYNYHLGSGDNGNVYSITNNKDNSRSQSFTYDTLNRITEAQEGSRWGATFSIDAWGNLYQTGSVPGTSSLAMSVNQQVNTSNQFTQLGYSYDSAGNVILDGLNYGCDFTGFSSFSYAWDSEEHMTCAAGTYYANDGDGHRVEKGSSTLYWRNRAGAVLAESDLSGNIQSEYIFFNGTRIARRDISGGVVHYYLSDHLGSSNVVTDPAGNISDDSDFYPYGGEYTVSQSFTQHYKFTGNERDTESGGDDFGARHYASTMGRFMSPDPHNPILVRQGSIAGGLPIQAANNAFLGFLNNPQNWSEYSYVRNDPLGFIDPTGQSPVSSGGHHLLVERGNISNPMARDFANSIRTGGPNPPSNVWSNESGHPAYNDAVNEIRQELEQTEGDSNSWSVSQWKDFATKVLNSDEPDIKNFLDQIEAEAPGSRAKLAAAIAAYQPSKAVIARTYAWAATAVIGVVFEDLLSDFVVCVTCHESVTLKIDYNPPPLD